MWIASATPLLTTINKVAQNGRALEFASAHLKADKEVVLVAVSTINDPAEVADSFAPFCRTGLINPLFWLIKQYALFWEQSSFA